MKKIILLAALFTVTMGLTKTSEAQVRVAVNINIGSQPVWGPVGYDYVQYYYMPDIDVYYYVPTSRYVYLDRGRWIFASSLPVRYRNFDLYSSYKVVINEPKAYLRHNVHAVNYKQYKGYKGKQVIIRNSNEVKYSVVNKNFKKQDEKHDNNKDKNDKNK